MKLLILNWKDMRNPDVGGAEVILYEISKRLVRDGHSVTWFCRGFPGGQQEELRDGIRFIRRGNRFTVYWEAYTYYRSLLNKPDKVLDCINTICWQTPLYVPADKRLAYVNQLAKEVLLYELPPVVSAVAFLTESLEYLTYKTTRFLCYSDSVKEDLATFGIAPERVGTFPVGIDLKRYTPGRKSEVPLFVFVARLARMKRPDLCIEAMRIVVRKYPYARLAVVGYGPMERQISGMITRFGLKKNISLINKDALYFEASPKDRKVKLMQEAWALLLPSVKEGWGLVVTEAGACATPSIVTEVTGLVDSVQHGVTGIVMSNRPSAEELAGHMMRIIEDTSLRNALSKNARLYSQKYSWETSYRKFLALL